MLKSKVVWTAIAAIATTIGLFVSGEITAIESFVALFTALQTINFRHTLAKGGK